MTRRNQSTLISHINGYDGYTHLGAQACFALLDTCPPPTDVDDVRAITRLTTHILRDPALNSGSVPVVLDTMLYRLGIPMPCNLAALAAVPHYVDDRLVIMLPLLDKRYSLRTFERQILAELLVSRFITAIETINPAVETETSWRSLRRMGKLIGTAVPYLPPDNPETITTLTRLTRADAGTSLLTLNDVWTAVAEHPNMTPDLLREAYATWPNFGVYRKARDRVTAHPNCPGDVHVLAALTPSPEALTPV